MLKTFILLIVLLPYLLGVRLSWSSGLTEVPDFSDEKNWAFVEEGPFIYPTPWGEYNIGTIRKYRRIAQPHVVGFEEFLFGSEKSFWKRWGPEASPFIYHALRKGLGGMATGSAGELLAVHSSLRGKGAQRHVVFIIYPISGGGFWQVFLCFYLPLQGSYAA